MLLAGQWVDRDDGIDVVDPQDGAIVDRVPRASRADMRSAIDAAAAAAPVARCRPVHERMRLLHDVADRLAGAAESHAETIAREGIKTIREARAEVERAIGTVRLAAEELRRLHGETVAFDQRPGSEDRFGYWTRVPLGIVGAITPFNDPLNLVAHKLAPAFAAGNAVIVKPDSKAPLSALRLGAAFHEAGAPAGSVQVLTGPGEEIGTELAADGRVRLLSFTGGVEVGERIAGVAGIKRLAMELGSNCPVIVMGDAELERAVPRCVAGAFAAAGQNCLHVQRIFAHASVYELFRDRFVAAAGELRLGDKLDERTDMGPLIDESAARRVESLVASAVADGANLLLGGTREGTRVEPTVVEGVSDDRPLSCDEVYGPVTVLYRFDTVAEAIERANAVDYGLHAAVFTRSLAVARRAVEGLEVGGVLVNDSTDYRIDAMPFGGTKRSGLGREGIRFALEEMTEPKLVCYAFDEL